MDDIKKELDDIKNILYIQKDAIKMLNNSIELLNKSNELILQQTEEKTLSKILKKSILGVVNTLETFNIKLWLYESKKNNRR